jgi:hypothetical protein
MWALEEQGIKFIHVAHKRRFLLKSRKFGSFFLKWGKLRNNCITFTLGINGQEMLYL